MDEAKTLELAACKPVPIDPAAFNSLAILPYGVTIDHIRLVMGDFVDFLGFVNTQLHIKGLKRLEAMMMQTNFSSIVSEYMKANLPHYCGTVVTNRHHNGHPDLLPFDTYLGDDVEHGAEGIEIAQTAEAATAYWQAQKHPFVWRRRRRHRPKRPSGIALRPSVA